MNLINQKYKYIIYIIFVKSYLNFIMSDDSNSSSEEKSYKSSLFVRNLVRKTKLISFFTIDDIMIKHFFSLKN